MTINNTATPVITSQPIASVTISEGTSTTLSVTATGATGYQWYKDGNEIIDATTISYTTVNTLSATGTYYVIVNGACNTSVSSTNSVVSVSAIPQGSLSGSTIMPGQAGYLRYTSSNTPRGGPFTIVYQEEGGSTYTISNVISGDIFEIQGSSISNTTSFTLISVTDQTSTGSRTFEFTGATATVTVSNLNIGDSYEGGKIAYFLQRGDLGYIAGEIHGFVAATSNENINQINWLDAKNACDVKDDGTYSDWRLPTKDELNIMYTNIGRGASGNDITIGNFGLDFYWSSTIDSGGGVWAQHMIGESQHGVQYPLGPGWGEAHVRAIRTF